MMSQVGVRGPLMHLRSCVMIAQKRAMSTLEPPVMDKAVADASAPRTAGNLSSRARRRRQQLTPEKRCDNGLRIYESLKKKNVMLEKDFLNELIGNLTQAQRFDDIDRILQETSSGDMQPAPECPEQQSNLDLYTALLKEHLKLKNYDRGISEYEKLVKQGVSPSAEIGQLAIRMAMGANDSNKALSIYSRLQQTEKISLSYHWSPMYEELLRGLGAAGRSEDAKEVAKGMEMQQIKLSPVCQAFMDMENFQKMPFHSVKEIVAKMPETSTAEAEYFRLYRAAFEIASEQKLLDQMVLLYNDLRQSQRQTPEFFVYYQEAARHLHLQDPAEVLLTDYEIFCKSKNPLCKEFFSELIMALCKEKMTSKAVDLVSSSASNHKLLSTSALRNLMKNLQIDGDLKEGMKLYGLVTSDAYLQDSKTVGYAIQMAIESMNLKKAAAMLENALNQQVEIPVALAGALLDEAIVAEQLHLACKIMTLMKANNLHINRKLYSRLNYSLSRSDLWKQASKIVNDHKLTEDPKFTSALYNTAISAAFNGKHPLEVVKLYESMIEEQLRPPQRIVGLYCCTLTILGRHADAIQAFEESDDPAKPFAAFVYKYIMQCYLFLDYPEQALQIFHQVQSREKKLSSVYYDAAVVGYAKLGDIEKAQRFVAKCSQSELTKDSLIQLHEQYKLSQAN